MRLTAPEAWRCMTDPLLRAILRLKFEPIEPLGAWFAGRLAKLVNAEGSKLSADVVVPVPLHG
jgi:predicted amidophosphoribosyltransferase